MDFSLIIAYVPRDQVVQIAEVNQQTVIEFAPDSAQATVYRQLAETIQMNTETSIPTPLEMHELEALARKHIPV